MHSSPGLKVTKKAKDEQSNYSHIDLAHSFVAYLTLQAVCQ